MYMNLLYEFVIFMMTATANHCDVILEQRILFKKLFFFSLKMFIDKLFSDMSKKKEFNI